jgi:drug/metabolite transporter (DMT)-like permease
MLMKLGLVSLNPYEVAGLRLLSAGLVLLPFFPKAWKNTNTATKLYSVLIGLMGSFFPGILFCIAETSLHSSYAAILNATTPLFVMLMGYLFFKRAISLIQFIGILAGFLGVLVLFAHQLRNTADGFPFKVLLVLLATVMYGLNVNVANRYLTLAAPLEVASLSLVLLIPVDFLMLLQQGFFTHIRFETGYLQSVGASVFLGIVGTAFATWLFYVLMQRAGPLFSSMVTYGLPFVAIGWGLLAGESVNGFYLGGLALILLGVYFTHPKKSP